MKDSDLRDSMGRWIARDPIHQANFRSWFERSRVVDSYGRPLVVFHGTRFGDIEEFDTRRSIGIFFTSDPAVADTYNGWTYSRGMMPIGGTTYATFLSLQNPLEIDGKGRGWLDIRGDGLCTDDLAVEASDRGFDGLIVRNVRDGSEISDIYVAFEPAQIKSALGNSGAFAKGSCSICDFPPIGRHGQLIKVLSEVVSNRHRDESGLRPALHLTQSPP